MNVWTALLKVEIALYLCKGFYETKVHPSLLMAL